jgi:hypothetical protein
MTINCDATPINTLFGCRKTSPKSFTVNVIPIPNMITPSKIDMYGPIQRNWPGRKKASAATTSTHMANVLPKN